MIELFRGLAMLAIYPIWFLSGLVNEMLGNLLDYLERCSGN